MAFTNKGLLTSAALVSLDCLGLGPLDIASLRRTTTLATERQILLEACFSLTMCGSQLLNVILSGSGTEPPVGANL